MRTVATVPETDHQDAGDARDQLRRSGTLRLFRGPRFGSGQPTGRPTRGRSTFSLSTPIPAAIACDRARRGLRPRRVRAGARGRCSLVRAGPGRKHPDPSARSRGSHRGAVRCSGGPRRDAVLRYGRDDAPRTGGGSIYGVEEDRSLRSACALAFTLAATVEVMLMMGLARIVAGGSTGEGSDGGAGSGVWSFVRWPVGVGLVAIAMTVIFRLVPNRHQPGFRGSSPGRPCR